MLDVTRNRMGGDVCQLSNGKPIVWNGHLCEGANLTPPRDDHFCLWTRCGKHDVPANAAHEGSREDVECAECKRIAQLEATQERVG
jgi:hypothetical protein